MKKELLLRLLISLSVLWPLEPLYAQKQFLPALRTGTAGSAPLSKIVAGRSSERALEELTKETGGRILSNQAGARPFVPQTDPWGPQSNSLRKIIQRQLIKPFLAPYYSVTRWRTHQEAAKREEPGLATFEQFQETIKAIDQIRLQHPVLKKMLHATVRNTPVMEYSSLAVLNNKLLLSELQYLQKKVDWLMQYPNQGRDAIQSVVAPPGKMIRQLAARLQNEKMILLGEGHYRLEVQQAVGDLILALKKQNPSRRIVVFSEFVHLPPPGPEVVNQTVETYYRRVDNSTSLPLSEKEAKQKRYAGHVFRRLARHQIDIYPLEDQTQIDLLNVSNGSAARMLQISYRNKMWARVIEHEMAQIRKTNPDALFIVYAGLGHVSRQKQYPLAAFFAPEKPVTIEFQFELFMKQNSLYWLWGEEKDPLFSKPLQASFSYWTGADAKQLARNSGFDYMVILPQSAKGYLMRKYVSFVYSL